MWGRGGRLAIGGAAEVYRGILDDIEAYDYDVFSRRGHVSGMQQLAMLPGIWWRARKQSTENSQQITNNEGLQ